jgi:hypothetical protein
MFRRLRKHSTQDDNNNNNNNNTNNVENNHHRSAAVSSRSASEGNIADNHLSLPPFSEALSLPLISEPSTRRRRRSGRSSNPNCSRTCSGSRRRRRSQRNLRIEQLVANEIGSILLDQDWNQTSNDSPPPPLQRRPSRRNSQPRVSFSFLRSMRSVHTESTQEQEPQPEQQRAASESTTTHNMARRRSSRRQSISDENESDDCSLADSDTINIYSLFGGDPQKSCSTAVIYSQDYTLAVAPLFVFLACIFIILIVVRILVALLTMAMGYMAVVLGVAALVDFLRHPMWNTRKLLAATHYAPVLVFGGLGGFLSACRVMYVHGRWDEASVVWGLLEGLVYGVGLGALWLLVFGDASDHSRVTLWIFQGWGRLCDCCNVADYDDIDDNDPNTTNARSCMICLEPCRDKLQTLPCLHGFHPDCLEQWLLVKRSCPICRVAIDSSPIIPMTIEE